LKSQRSREMESNLVDTSISSPDSTMLFEVRKKPKKDYFSSEQLYLYSL
jgi:hypothetical protein